MLRGADRDDRVGRVDRDAAAVGVRQAHDVVDMGVPGQQLALDALDREFDDAGDALHRLRDRQDVARAHRAVGIAVALEGVARQRLPRRRRHRGHRQALELASRRHAQHPLVHPAAGRDVLQRVADRHVVAQHGGVGRQVHQRDLVALRHVVAQHQAGGQHRALG